VLIKTESSDLIFFHQRIDEICIGFVYVVLINLSICKIHCWLASQLFIAYGSGTDTLERDPQCLYKTEVIRHRGPWRNIEDQICPTGRIWRGVLSPTGRVNCKLDSTLKISGKTAAICWQAWTTASRYAESY